MPSTLPAFELFQYESWRPALRAYRKKLLHKIPKTDSKREKVIIIQNTHHSKSVSATTSEVSTSPSILTVAPSTHSSLQIVGKGRYALNEACSIPEFQNDDEIMIRTYAVGLNPIDWKSVDYNFCLPEFPWVTGRECSGVVESIAPGVTKFKVGDKVWTSTYYRDIRAGCFQDLVTVPQHTVAQIPGTLSYEAAACLGVGPLTSAMTLWRWLGVSRDHLHSSAPGEETPSADRECILIWGGSTCTGQIAVQLSAQAGLEVIAVASKRTASLVYDLGAHHVITRDAKSSEEIVAAIQTIAGDRITRYLDLVGGKTPGFGLQAVSRTQKCLFAPLAFMDKKTEVPDNVEVVTVEMKQFVNDKSCEVYAEDLNALVASGRLRLPELDILEGGLSVVEAGLDRLKKGDLGGRKLVVKIQR